MTILDKIVQQKKKEVEQLKRQALPDVPPTTGQVPSITRTFHNTERMNIIAEIKRSSPSKGAIDLDVNPGNQATLYASNGAGAISVLTDETFFKGSMNDLHAVRKAVDVPLLCKDFFIDKVQIDHAKAAGASIILLIVAAMSPSKLQELHTYASEQGLDVLVEVHDEDEMKTAIESRADVIGINNRNLKTFDVDLNTTGRLASMVTNPDTILISESGIKTRNDVAEAAGSGARAVLIGETLMWADDLPQTISELQVPLTEGEQTNVR
ncbi:MAG TPA: indole-3-glycerol phosphate synthase TrpC [Lentibacillus sp.]|uniref:indole-3-glycerol phosphate synthase TrpC n=1 Tax=Lentibacillus sp. TaxID=1925746 RepID=UPI002B4B5681|nr:indole-3-glycerol phosphate synthase TrpC [Lentibacillus sp.]HLR61001.1 indole-3-glycerol phosphate synthase TrpC [Lentibacillus sp.]